jgi:hypothetical protein
MIETASISETTTNVYQTAWRSISEDIIILATASKRNLTCRFLFKRSHPMHEISRSEAMVLSLD